MTWSIRNVRAGRWWDRGPRGFVSALVEDDDAQVGVNLFVLEPGQPMSKYHWEADQEGFLVLSGEALAIVENEERPLRQWDYFHCPPHVSHTIVGAGEGPCAVLALGGRIETLRENWGHYPYSDVAMRHDASAEEETSEPKVAYARFPQRREAEFRDGWLS